MPAADAIIHPRHPEGAYPFGELAGVGVAFKLACALLGEVPEDLLELVAIGTVADLSSAYVDENRYFVKEGIRRMRVSKRPAIQALARIAGTEQATLIRGVNRIYDWSPTECCRTSRGCYLLQFIY